MRKSFIGALLASSVFAGHVQAGSPVTINNPANTQTAIVDASGLHVVCDSGCAVLSPDGSVSVVTQPYPELSDTFSGASLDVTTNWTLNNSGGSATLNGTGALVVASSGTNAAWGGTGSKQSFTPAGISLQIFGVQASVATLVDANTAAIWGMATIPATPTAAVPVTNGYIWRLDGTGALFAEVWNAGVAVSSTNVTIVCGFTAGTAILYGILYRQSLAEFTCGQVVATISTANPATNILPASFLSVAGTSPTASRSVTFAAMALASYTPAALKPAGLAPTVNDPSLVVSLSPNSSGITSTPVTNTPVAGTTATIVTGGTAVTFVTGPIKGGYITNPINLAAEGIAAAENLYIDPVGTPGSTDAAANGTTVILTPGQPYALPALAAGVLVKANAATSGHKATVVVW